MSETDKPKVNPDGGRFWKVIEKIGLKSLATGNFGWFVLLIISTSIVWKLNSADLKEVILKVISTIGWVGYAIAPVTIYVCVRILNWREKIHAQEMDRLIEVRNQLVQSKFELPIQSSVEKDSK